MGRLVYRTRTGRVCIAWWCADHLRAERAAELVVLDASLRRVPGPTSNPSRSEG